MGNVVGSYLRRSSSSTNEAFDSKYEIGEELGTGAFASVRVAINKLTKERVAVKVVDRMRLDEEDDLSLKDEAGLLSEIDHPHIVKLYDFYEDPRRYHLVLELCEGGELFDKIVEKRCYTEKEARDLVKILLDAISYCHDRLIVHRDLKPENLLLTNSKDVSSIKIADFGLAEKMVQPNSLTCVKGSPGYVAPEILSDCPYGEAVDCWSIGVIMYILMVGYPPFADNSKPRLFQKIKNGEYKFHTPYWNNVSDDAKDLIRRLLTVDPKRRITARQALQHCWMKEHDDKLSSHDLSGSLATMREFNAKRRLKAGIGAVMMANRLQRLIQAHHSTKGQEELDQEESKEPYEM